MRPYQSDAPADPVDVVHPWDPCLDMIKVWPTVRECQLTWLANAHMVSRSRAGGGELRSVPLGLRIKPSLREELDRLAEADRRTLASYVEIVLEQHVDAKKKQEGKRR
jgi:hypothetical protein